MLSGENMQKYGKSGKHILEILQDFGYISAKKYMKIVILALADFFIILCVCRQ